MTNETIQPRDGFGHALLRLGALNKDVVVLSGDLKESTRCLAFAEAYPERFIEVGVAEQNMMGIASGLADEGFIPFVTSFAVFSPGRNWDQLRVSVCYGNTNVKIIGSHAGLSAGPDGATHQALEDIAITRVLPNLTVLAPADANEVHQATLAAAKITGPVYIRFNRSEELVVTKPTEKFTIGKAKEIQDGRDVAVLTTGSMLGLAKKAVEKMSKKASIALIHHPSIKPIDTKSIIEAARKTKSLVTVEEAQLNGGFGSAVLEVISDKSMARVQRVGVKDSFGQSGKPDELREKYHIAQKDIEAAILQALIKK